MSIHFFGRKRVRQWYHILVFSALCTIICWPSYADAEPKIYRWKDKNGNWVYSDIAQKGAQEMKLNRNTLTMPSVDTQVLTPKVKADPIQYQATITTPEHEQTIRDNSGSVHVAGRIEPRFSQGLSVQLFVNGKATGPKQTTTQFALRNLYRGEHTLVLKAFNNKGQLVAQSEPVTFFLHRNSINN